MTRWLFSVALALLAGCSGVPKGLKPVSGFDVDRYMGHWYEIERLDNRFERGLINVTTDYRKLPDGRIEVINRGFDIRRQQWRQARGVGRSQGRGDVASLEVSFFWPFYGAYNVLMLDSEYRYALVSGASRKYLWILARKPQLDPPTLRMLIDQAKEWGFDADSLTAVEHLTVPQKTD